MVRAYSVIEAAEAIGVTKTTMYRYLRERLVPEPVLFDTSRKAKHFSRDEICALAEELRVHEKSYTGLFKNHYKAIAAIKQAMVNARRTLRY